MILCWVKPAHFVVFPIVFLMHLCMTHITFRRACTWLPMILVTAGGTAQSSSNLASLEREAERLQRYIQRHGERIEQVGADIDRRMSGHIALIDQII